MRNLLCLLVFVVATFGLGAEKKSRERVVVRTIGGDMVFALYPEVAPKTVEQFLKLARAGVYDSTHFYRVEPGFVIQLATAQDRTLPLNPEQFALIKKLPAEFSLVEKHRRGSLSMAREDHDPDSSETSFSILLSDAPHLDGKYTIFGELERGFEVLDQFLRVSQEEPNRPSVRLTVNRMEVLETESALSRLVLTGPVEIREPPKVVERQSGEMKRALITFLSLAILLLTAGIWLGGRGDLRRARALNMLTLLVISILTYAIAVPSAQSTIGSGILFAAILGLFKIMGSFENRLTS